MSIFKLLLELGSALPWAMAHHVPSLVKELLELTGWPQWRLGKQLGVSQGTISKWLNEQNEPTKSQWDKVLELYAEHKGWTMSLDDKLARYDPETQQRVHDIVDRILQIAPPPRRHKE